MKVLNPIGSKERFLEMFQGVTKVNLNEVATGVMQTGTQLVAKAFEELKNKQASIKQTNTQVVGDENFVEIVTNDQEGNVITFTFRINSTEADQDGVFNVDNAVLSKFVIKSPTLNVEMPENMQAVQDFNAAHGSEIMSVVGEYADFETDTMSVDDEQVYSEAVKFIDKIPYKKGSEEIQTHKNYADNKPTNPEVRVDADELQKFVKEMQDYADSADDDYTQDVPMEDPMADPTEYTAADAAEILRDPNADDKSIKGIDPYDQIDVEYEEGEASPEDQALFSQAYDNLVAAGNQAPTAIDIENEVNRLQGNVKPVEKTRAIPKGAEAFWENKSVVTDMNADAVMGHSYEKTVSPQAKEMVIKYADEALTKRLGDRKSGIPKEEYLKMVRGLAVKIFLQGAAGMNESTDQDRYEDVVFMQGEEADEPLEILRNQGEDAAMQYLMQWHSPGQHMGSQELGHGSSDQTYEKDGYTMAWNFPLNYIGLQYELSGLDEETEKGDYPDQIGKKFKPKNQMPKKKKRPQSVVKLGEESEIPREYWGNPEDEMNETEELPDEKPEDGDFIEGGKADDADVSKYDPDQIVMGIKIEMEHTDDPKVALEIAMDHLEEIPDYYTRLDKMEKEAGVTDEGMGDNTPEEEELTDELLGFKPYNVGDYANEEELDSPIPANPEQERQYWDKEYYNQDQEKEEPEELIDEEDGFEEYAGEIGDRYQDGEGNQFTVRDKVKGGVTLQGQGGESEIATSDIKYLKKLSEAKVEKKEIITEEQIKTARQVLKDRDFSNGMTKKEAVQLLIKHNIK